MKRETVIVLDFGGQYNQLIARRVRECNVYCEIYSYKTDLEKIKAMEPKGIIFTGGPNSVYLEDSPSYAKEIYDLGIPVLGICYGSQLMMHQLGGKVCKAPVREYGKIEVTVDQSSALFENVSEKTICWMSHNDYIEQAAPGFKIIAHTPDCPVAAVENVEKKLYGHNAKNVMKTDIKELEGGYELEIDLPGFKKEEVQATLEDGYLTISAEKGLDQDEQEKKTGKYIRKERYAGACQRSFYVGDNLTQEDIKGEFKHGILTLNVPKKEAKPAVETNKYIAIEG